MNYHHIYLFVYPLKGQSVRATLRRVKMSRLEASVVIGVKKVLPRKEKKRNLLVLRKIYVNLRMISSDRFTLLFLCMCVRVCVFVDI